jgi:Threonine dehydratase
MVSLEDVERAQRVIHGRVHRTPLLRSATLSERLGADAHLKAELFQRTGSFKVRGVLNTLSALSDEEKRRGVITISPATTHRRSRGRRARRASTRSS